MRKIIAVISLLLVLMLVLPVLNAGTEKTASKVSSNVLSALEDNDKVKVIIQTSDNEKAKGREIFRNTFAAELTESEISELNENPGIKSVTLDQIKHVFLQNSSLIVNATKTWPVQVSGINLTGKDQTVCVIDTGINSSHPDLVGKVLGGYCYCNISGGCCAGSQAESSTSLDDEGHGTHVAGIIATKGNITGIAPDAKLVSLKVCNSAGSCLDSDIISGINWCVANSSGYNISVISISLGGEEYDHYCDSEPNATAFVNPINAAIAKNITVVIASGNNATGTTNITKIASPACIQNATAVTATDKTDAFASYAKRNSLVKLAAPGDSINSTCYNCSYIEKSGTSMAAPHVSAAIALLQQYANSKLNRDYTASEAVSILNNTGRQLNDSTQSSQNYSRLNIFGALNYIDNSSAPLYEWISSPNSTYPNATVLINLTVTDSFDPAVYNITINSTQYVMNKSSPSYYYRYTPLNEGNFTYNCTFIDPFGNPNKTDPKVLAVNITYQSPVSYKISPENSTFTANSNITFRINATDNSLKNSTLYIWNSTAEVSKNMTDIAGSLNETNWTYSLDEISYIWNALVCDSSDKCSWTENGNSTLTIDKTNPSLSFSISDTSITTSESATITCNSTDTNLGNLTLYASNSAVNTTSTNLTYINITYTFSGSAGTYVINCTAYDKASNTNTTNSSIIVSSASSGGSPSNDDDDDDSSSTTASSDEYSRTFAYVTASEPITAIPGSLARESTGIDEVFIVTSVDVENVEVSIKQMDESDVSKEIEDAYKYISIKVSNIDSSILKKAQIKFEVEKSWIKDNEYNKSDVILSRYHDKEWQKLETDLIDEDSSNYYYKAQTPGFSTFAISIKKANETKITANPTNASIISAEEETEKKAGNLLKEWWFLAAAGLILVSGIVSLIFYLIKPKGHHKFHPKA